MEDTLSSSNLRFNELLCLSYLTLLGVMGSQGLGFVYHILSPWKSSKWKKDAGLGHCTVLEITSLSHLLKNIEVCLKLSTANT